MTKIISFFYVFFEEAVFSVIFVLISRLAG